MAKRRTNEQNNCKPLEELKVVITKDGVTKEVPALSPGWREERQHVYYKPPPTVEPDGSFPIGAKEAWLERMEFLNSDLSWLLELQQYRFWSQLLYHEETLNMILSFLQEAPPYYAIEEFPQDEEMWNSFQRTHYLMFLLINRLATYKESETEFISPGYLGKLIYDYYVFTIPMILDICMFYGRENRCHVLKIINTVFNIQPQYQEDLKKSVPFICKVLRFVEHKFGGRKLPEGELVKLSERPDRREEMTLLEFKDLVLHMLDTAANLSLFLDIYTPACKVFHQQLFEMKIVHFYENTVPQMYRKLELLANKDDTQPVYVDLKHKLDIMRVELLKVFRLCLATCINPILENIDTVTEAEVKKYVDDYVGVLTECLSEKVFIRDYHSAYPVDHDLDALSQVCPEMDFMKCDFLLEAVLSSFDLPDQNKMKNAVRMRTRRQEPIPDIQKNGNLPVGGSGESAHKVPPKKRVTGIELESLITEVKDILPHLGDGFVEKCLEQFNFASDSVINAILEDTLPLDLRSSDQTLPRIPPDTKELDEATNGMQRLNVFDNDEFDVMTQDQVDTSRIHKGKRKGKHKTLNELIDDKSHRAEFRDMYNKFGIVDTEGSMYDDEYDDTYDLLDVSVGDEGDLERRPFVVPRVLRGKDEESSGADSDGEEPDEQEAKAGPPRDEFVQNPEEVRARAEQRRQQMHSRARGWRRGPPPSKDKDVVGRPKGQGQDKQVVINRDHKTAHKSSRGNHNRRVFSQRKRQQGMIS
ncbi:activating signal cointegrator 1 complex subunit 2 [Periplaneta americana]|uniref:activating signal cointegrator 1 complex subunit 2 n=1 Tax=Periplaneta americana TaxID=6978 RepID=UPI0037E7998B